MRITLSRAILVASTAALAAGCLPGTDPVEFTEERVTLLAFVVAGADGAYFLLQRSSPGGGSPESGATLTVRTPGGQVTLEERPGTECGTDGIAACYRGDYPAPPETDDEIVLSGLLPSGAEITGRTVVPSPPDVRTLDGDPADSVRVPGPRIFLDVPDGQGWVGLGGRAASTAWLGGEARPCETRIDGLLGLDVSRSWSFPVVLSPTCDPELPTPGGYDSLAVELPLTRFDDSGTRYMREAGAFTQPVFEPVSFGVDGVNGVFGSVTTRIVKVVVVPGGDG